jgi:hypothetical protein
MKHLRIESLYIGIFAILFIAATCEKNDEPKPTGLTGTWQLKQVVNISDEEKYLYSELQIGSDNRYKQYSNTGNLISEGTYQYEEDTLRLEVALFENIEGMGRYGIHNLDDDGFTLKERYTLDNKNAILEYIFEKK